MILRPDAKELVARIKRARKMFGLNLHGMAAELRIRPEWLSKILNGHQSPSYNIGLRFDDFLRRHGTQGPELATTDLTALFQRTPRAPTSVQALQTEIRLSISRLLATARNDPARLRWIAKKLRTDLAPPRSWTKPKSSRTRVSSSVTGT